ncbi:MAG TPA: GMC family oxidoreductase [Chitinophagaceae bacterium]|nr:GMC family oxidoreductase [Chitinophagaceae bacterium]
MHIDARLLDDRSVIEGDICIIGTGAAGLSMALEWVDTPYKVILLEGGGFEYDEKVQELYNGKILGHPYYPMKSSRLHYFGGSTGHWGGMCSTMDEIDFVKRDWVENSGWPIRLEDIAACYPRAHKNLDLGPYEYDVKYWQKQEQSFVPMPLEDEILWTKMWQLSPPTRFGTKYKDAVVNAKNIHLYTYANVVDIQATENISAIKEVTVKNHAGKQHTVRARYFVMACCSIQNARLLLASNKQAPAGLGNGNDLVGRYFMEHIEIGTGELWVNKPESLVLYRRTVHKQQAELAISRQKQEELKLLNATVAFVPLDIAKVMEPSVKTWSEDDPRKALDKWSKYYQNAYKKGAFRHVSLPFQKYQAFGLYTRSEQAPNPDSRVTLSKEIDALGVPRADLTWQMTPIDKKTLRAITQLLGQQVGKAGIGRVKMADFLLDEKDETVPPEASGGWHHIGTTRMSDTPKTGVVDKNCKVHGIENLFIAGSACFPTSGAINPTLTLVALTLRLSDHLKEQIKANHQA